MSSSDKRWLLVSTWAAIGSADNTMLTLDAVMNVDMLLTTKVLNVDYSNPFDDTIDYLGKINSVNEKCKIMTF